MDLLKLISEFNFSDPVDRVFGIVTIGALIVFFALFFFDPGEILGFTRESLLLFTGLGFGGAYLGFKVVKWFRK